MMTIGELGQIAPAFDWPHYFSVQGAPGVAKLNVSQPEFVKAVPTQLTTEPVDALRAYLRFHFLTAAAPFLAHPFEQADFDFYSKTLRGVPDMPPRWKTCTRGVDRALGEALGQEFVKRTLPPTLKPRRS
jgi:endothelin-converting enzyme/putative endopeptidase